ncbi:MAG: hypothetical protein HY655_13685 [Acidobacteria bacterium]|nr:hypothetical protein [Acidobacteriota bacterium]
MTRPAQTYKNHARLRPSFHFFVVPVLLLNFFIAVWQLIQAPALGTAWGLVFAAALVVLAFVARGQAISVQDRVIRIEMRLRLQRLLPPDLQPRINDLTTRQLVALRFASDEELPDLVREVLAGNLPSQKSIKMRVKNWQADWLRA